MRKLLNAHPWVVVPAMIVLVLLAGYTAYSQFRQALGMQGSPGLYFSDDDGNTWYSEKPGTLSPTTRNGKESVRAHVYSCEGRSFVAYLERFTPEARAALESAVASAQSGGARPDQGSMQRLTMAGMQVKLPGDKQWVPAFGQAGSKLRQPKCDDASSAQMVP